MAAFPRFRDVLDQSECIPGEVIPGPSSPDGLALARQRAPAHLLERGRTSDLVIVAQQNIASTSVQFDLGFGWREHFCASAAAVYVIPAEADARWRLDGESQCVYLSLPFAEAYLLLESFGISHPADCVWSNASRGFDEPLVHESIMRLWQEVSAVGASPLLASSCRVAVLHALARRGSQVACIDGRAMPKLQRTQLQRVLAAIHEMPPEGLSIERLASVAGLSPFHFSRLFRNSVGCSPYRYYDGVRFELARDLLSSTKLPVAEVARRLGFADPSQFARAFRRRAGCAPGAYREQCRG